MKKPMKPTVKYAAIFAAATLAAIALMSQAASAKEAAAASSGVKVFDAWAKTTVPGGSVSAAYMHIKSPTPVKLVKAETPISGNVEIHDMKMKDGVMEMKAIDAVDIPANKLVDLKPGGMHVMLMKLNKPINKGDSVPLTLTFEGPDKKTFTMNVDAKAQEKDSGKHSH
jgi:periplasmic copper chaperone A